MDKEKNMTVYEIPNIEHCTVTPMVNGNMYKIVSHEGWYIHLNDDDEQSANIWKGAVILQATYDFSIVEIRAFEDLPTDAEICGTVTNSEKE